MTLTVVQTSRDHAWVMTDSLQYNASGSVMQPAPEPKATLLAGIDTVVSGLGSADAGDWWSNAAAQLADAGASFDDLADHAQQMLTRYIAEPLANSVGGYDPTADRVRSHAFVAYLVGWSSRHRRFRALVCCDDRDFEPEDVSGRLSVFPAPPGCPPASHEQRHRVANGVPPLPDGKPLRRPLTSDAEWRGLARTVHEARAQATVSSGLKVFMGGDVTLTRLEVGRSRQDTIYTFDADEFHAMIGGTFHPMVQLGPCRCGSGDRFTDCCILEIVDRLCLCGSGATFGDCCRVTADEPAVAA